MWFHFNVCTFNDIFSTACKGFIHNSTAHKNAMHVYVDSFSVISFTIGQVVVQSDHYFIWTLDSKVFLNKFLHIYISNAKYI